MLGHGALGELALGETEGDGGTSLFPSSISSAEAFGTHFVGSDGYVILAAGGIASAEAFGEPQLDEDRIVAIEISSAEAFGAPSLILVIAPASIASAESVSSPRLYELVTYLPVSRL
jgi:hypothetical protein